MTTVLLVRHGLTHLTGPVLTGRAPGIDLDDRGRAQATALAARLRPVPLAAIVTSPLDRCRATAAAILDGRDPGPAVEVDDRFAEVDYGSWTGRAIRDLAKEPLWKVVQGHPSAAVFPDGEGLAGMAARATSAIRDWNARLGPDATYAVVTHADLIKALVADALGLHLDGYQRVTVDPCSLTAIRYTGLRAFVERTNDTGGDVASLVPKPARRRGVAAGGARNASPHEPTDEPGADARPAR